MCIGTEGYPQKIVLTGEQQTYNIMKELKKEQTEKFNWTGLGTMRERPTVEGCRPSTKRPKLFDVHTKKSISKALLDVCNSNCHAYRDIKVLSF